MMKKERKVLTGITATEMKSDLTINATLDQDFLEDFAPLNVDEINEKDLHRKRQSSNAKKPRPGKRKKQDREIVLMHWELWKQDPTRYKNKADFIKEMLELTYVNRPQTISDWINEFGT